MARIRKVLKSSRSTFSFTLELILPVYFSLDQAAAENPQRGNAWQFNSLSKKSPCSHWTLDTLCRLITFVHRCPLNLRHWQSGMISTLNLWPPTFSILNLVEAIQSPPYDTAYGLCQIIGQNNRFGPAQIASLTAEVKTIVECREICPHIFPSILEALKSSTSANVRMLGNRLEPLLQHDVFERRQNGSSSLPISPHIHIFDVSSYPDTIRTTLAELLLYDWFRSARALQIPIVIMVDEVQNLRLGRGTVLNRIITEGRKFSIGSILISQSLRGFAPDEQLALSQTGTKLFFKPPLTEIRACSEMLAEPVRRSGTVELLKKLKVGQCLLLSDFTHIGDSLQPSSDCIQVSINFPTSIIE